MRTFLLTGILLTGLLSMAQENQPGPAKDPNMPEITFEKVSHDFGKVKRGVPMHYDFVYKNTGKDPLLVSKCRAGCDCTTVSCEKENVKSGKKGKIHVSYDSTRVGKFKKEIMIQSNARNPMTLLFIEGEILADEPATDNKPDKDKPNQTNEKVVKTE